MPGLSCGMQDLLVVACGIFSCGMQTLSCGMRDLVPWPGVEPRPPALGAWSLSHWTIREVPLSIYFYLLCPSALAWAPIPCHLSPGWLYWCPSGFLLLTPFLFNLSFTLLPEFSGDPEPHQDLIRRAHTSYLVQKGSNRQFPFEITRKRNLSAYQQNKVHHIP